MYSTTFSRRVIQRTTILQRQLSYHYRQYHPLVSSVLIQNQYQQYYQHKKQLLIQQPQWSTPSFNNNNNKRCLSSSTTADDETTNDTEIEEEPREAMAFDVLIVGGGPAGLAASIKLKQLCLKYDKELSVCLIDKGSEIGAHILSGNVFDPKALEELFPEMAVNNGDEHWTTIFQNEQGSSATSVTNDQFSILTESGKSYTIPNFLLPNQLHNDGNYIISLSQLCRWLAMKAEELGVEIYPGFAASEVVFNDNTKKDGVIGIATRDVGIAKDGTLKPTYERGVELHARQTLFAEGARGSCSEFLIDHFQLRKGNKDNDGGDEDDSHSQTYGLGIKEVWEIPQENFQKGLVQHTIGFPLQSSITDDVYGGTFLYHQEPNLVLIGLVIGLDYTNPYIHPYKEFQKFKTHPDIAKHLKDGTCISYGARVLNEGGYHSIPNKLTFPGGALIGCSAGFLNAVKIKGSHTAMKSGMVAAEAVFSNLTTFDGDEVDEEEESTPVAETGELSDTHIPKEVIEYITNLKSSWVYDELYEVRNCHQAFSKWGIGGGMLYTGIAAHITKGKEPWTLHHTNNRDTDCTKPIKDITENEKQKISYPKPDGILTFDLLTNLQRSGTYHDDDQPSHLRIKSNLQYIPQSVSLQIYDGPEQRFCPAAVYEYVDNTDTDDNENNNNNDKPEKKLVINAQNCVHCKCCSIKMPKEYINWTVPEGGGGPQYQIM